MSTVTSITSKAALAVLLVASPAALGAQVTSTQDTARTPWPNRGPTTFPGRARTDTASDTSRATTTYPAPTTTASAVADSAFIYNAVKGNALEVQMGEVADDRADDSAVEDFAERMVSEHGSMGRQWATLASGQRIPVDAGITPGQKLVVDRLSGLSGRAFDSTYMSYMIRMHERDLETYQRQATSARNSDVRRLASTGVNAIQQHLTLARQVGARVGGGGVATADPDTGRRGRNDRNDRDERSRDRDDRAALRGEDRAFVMEVLSDHLMEIRLAERARRDGRSAETRRFAERLLDDFEDYQERWEDLAERHDLKVPKGLGQRHQEKVDRLEKASKQNFDRVYASIVAENLGSIVPYFQKEGNAVRVAAVRRLVDDQLPVIRQHLNRARQLEGQASAQAERDDRK
ncbi:MAG TPA: DUF4142 domain-containing protein [Gemmatimonadales bacterium]|nr:DUF4142 domain-containing protein [Gemmatimonadales bacterium]